VAWAAVDGDLERLATFREDVRTALEAAGFPSDPRPFTPHVTVSYQGDEATRQALATYRGDQWEATEFTLVESQAGTYRKLQSWPLPSP
jgi:2'-5' RNA ligase